MKNYRDFIKSQNCVLCLVAPLQFHAETPWAGKRFVSMGTSANMSFTASTLLLLLSHMYAKPMLTSSKPVSFTIPIYPPSSYLSTPTSSPSPTQTFSLTRFLTLISLPSLPSFMRSQNTAISIKHSASSRACCLGVACLIVICCLA